MVGVYCVMKLFRRFYIIVTAGHDFLANGTSPIQHTNSMGTLIYRVN
jgi:hypothetical protein